MINIYGEPKIEQRIKVYVNPEQQLNKQKFKRKKQEHISQQKKQEAKIQKIDKQYIQELLSKDNKIINLYKINIFNIFLIISISVYLGIILIANSKQQINPKTCPKEFLKQHYFQNSAIVNSNQNPKNILFWFKNQDESQDFLKDIFIQNQQIKQYTKIVFIQQPFINDVFNYQWYYDDKLYQIQSEYVCGLYEISQSIQIYIKDQIHKFNFQKQQIYFGGYYLGANIALYTAYNLDLDINQVFAIDGNYYKQKKNKAVFLNSKNDNNRDDYVYQVFNDNNIKWQNFNISGELYNQTINESLHKIIDIINQQQ